ncbi:MAG: DNA polymerase III subunit delta, partial [Muribaculaceae bacterium]|nr:DNA polymerase III subunit delta [Muribaculaceae bacterium]
MATDTVNFASIQNQIKKKNLAPVYLLHGEEGYFIDLLLSEAEQILPEGDRDFNQYILYAPQVDPDTVIDTCRRYPMMTDRQVVIVKEMQAGGARFIKGLNSYLESPNPSTVLFLAYRGEEFKGADAIKAIRKGGGIVFESKKLKDNMLAAAIEKFINNKGLSVDPKALVMLRDFVGNDLSRIFNEVNKLTVT